MADFPFLSLNNLFFFCVCVFLCVSHFLYSFIDWQILILFPLSIPFLMPYSFFWSLFFSPFWSLNFFLTLLRDKQQVKIVFIWASLVAQLVKNPPTMWETLVQSLGQEDPLEKGKAIHSSTLAWKVPWTEEPGGLQFMGLRRVGHDWATSLSHTGEGHGNPLQYSCLENPRGAWWAAVYGVAESDMTEVT